MEEHEGNEKAKDESRHSTHSESVMLTPYKDKEVRNTSTLFEPREPNTGYYKLLAINEPPPQRFQLISRTF